jgi:hypothetical protein
MNIHLIGNQVTLIGETILHLSFSCLKLILDPTMNLMVFVLLHSWNHDKEINPRNIDSSLLHIIIHQTYRSESSILFIGEAMTDLELNLGYTSMCLSYHL